MNEPLIEVREVHRNYVMGETVVRALRGVSLKIGEGELTSIIGPSGSGKSTLMHMIGCLDTPTAGSIRIAGEDVSNLDETALSRIRNRTIGFVFQQFNLLSKLSIMENVMTPLMYARIPLAERKVMAGQALAKVGLADRIGHKPTELSGGQRQRAAIARALVTSPGIILADEPTGALDTATGEVIMELFDTIHQDGTTIIVVTHDPEVAEHCPRTIKIRDGLVEDDRVR